MLVLGRGGGFHCKSWQTKAEEKVWFGLKLGFPLGSTPGEWRQFCEQGQTELPVSSGLLVGYRGAQATLAWRTPCPALHPKPAQRHSAGGFEHQQGEDRGLQG